MTFHYEYAPEVRDMLAGREIGAYYDGRRVLTEKQANECFVIVQKLLGSEGEDATLYAPGHEGPMWVVSLESADDWAIRLAALDGAFPEDVFVEPVAGWCLGLYPIT